MRLAWWGAAGVLLLEGLGGTLVSLWPRVKEGGFGGKIKVGRVDDYTVGSITYFTDARFYLSRVDDGFLALYRKCPHLGCVVPWRATERSEDKLASNGRFNCPCHGSIYDRYGRVTGGPAPRPMDLFPIKIEGGELIVDTGTVVQRPAYDKSQAVKA
ncbi:MAG: ubiquinol-cytochrome c reductase iron-sulfur subunit [Chloroflexi bacterium]|nr:ubiquinol-cytochrome c reductase iron-sulfur subunit [Chloroflexota bacterium]